MSIIRLIILVLMCNIAFAQKSKLTIYAYPINTFTKIPITKKGIKDAYEFKRKLKAETLIVKLEKALTSRNAMPIPSEMSNVRILVEVCSGKNVDEIVLDKGTILCYKNQCYELDKELIDIILNLFPEKKREEYTPVRFKKDFSE